MKDDDEFDIEDLTPSRADAIDGLLRFSARCLLHDADPQRFMARLAQDGPAMFPALFDDDSGSPRSAASLVPHPADDRADKARFFRTFGWSIASSMPLPANDFHPRKLPLPGRNEPCLCGSLKKFKHCCAPLIAQVPTLPPEALFAMVLDAMPRKDWAALPHTRIHPHLVLAAAVMLRDEEREADACKLIEPWAALPAPWPAARAELLDFLCDLYLDLDKPRKRKQLAQALVARGDTTVQSVGWQRLSMIAADAGKEGEAKEAFQRALRLTPDDPRVAILEVTTLLATGEPQRAQDRAAFHLKRLSRLPHALDIADSLGVLEEMAAGDFPALPDLADGDDDDDEPAWELAPGAPLALLTQCLEQGPPPALRLDLATATPQDLGALTPNAALAKALKDWRAEFPLRTPLMLWESIDPDELDQVFGADTWSPLLRRKPVLFDSFDVLDGVLLALDAMPAPLVAHLQSLLLDRGLQLWAQLRARFPQARCEWVHTENRPALRLLVRRIDLDATPRAENCFDELRSLVEVLNPHDNHGRRERLAAVYLRRDMAAQALALCERYPDDFVGMRLLHARALLALQRLDDAARLFQSALQANAHVLPLLKAHRRPAEPDVDSYQIGSPEQARIAVSAQHDLWRNDKAVQAWVQQQAGLAAGQPATPSLFDEGSP